MNNSILVTRHSDSELLIDVLNNSIHKLLNRYNDENIGWEGSTLLFGVKLWLESSAYKDTISFEKGSKINSVIKETYKEELRKIQSVKSGYKYKRFDPKVNKLTELVNRRFTTFDWFDQYSGSITNKPIGDFNPFPFSFFKLKNLLSKMH